ncbi:MAG: hypothetical protein ACPG77_12585, partial [Nannocystaceae bacterium]
MRVPVSALATLALLAGLSQSGCGKSSLIELRLSPCEFTSEVVEVALTIDAYDEAGSKLGGTVTKTFAIADPSVFDDGYATVGYNRPPDAMRADFHIEWSAMDGKKISIHTDLALPNPGDALSLTATNCMDVDGTDTETDTDTSTETDTSDETETETETDSEA